MKYAAIYVRVSTLEQKQHGLSVDNQIDSLIKYCEDHQLPYKIYNDAGISAHASYKKRPALLQLISDCQRNQISIILFTRLDRWFRSVKDYYLVMDQLHGVPWRAIWEDYETETSSGQLKVNIMLSVAEAEAARTSEKVRSVLLYKMEKGEYVGSACTGYKIVKVNGKTTLVKDEETQEMIETFFRYYLQSFSIMDAVRKTQLAGFPISHRLGRRIATNETYTGRSNGCRFESYISDAQWNEILEQRKRRTRLPKRPNDVYIFSGTLRCSVCGKRLLSYTNDKVPGKIMYRCQHLHSKEVQKEKAPYNRVYEADIESFFLEQLDSELKKEQEKINAVVKAQDNRNVSKMATIQEKLERLKDLYIDGEISKADYQKRKELFEEQIEKLNIKPIKALPELPTDWMDIYSSLSKEGKKAFVLKVVDSIDIDYGEIHDKARFHLRVRLV